jgi:hypothetical protein
MKKMILTIVAVLGFATAFAAEETSTTVSNVKAYDMTINMNKLSMALNLADDQKEVVENIHHTFAAEMNFAAQYGEGEREAMVKRAIDNDVKWMRYVLNDEQMRKYLVLLNATINNRGLNK